MGVLSASQPTSHAAANDTPPPPLREFRGAWVATVANIDWPSRKTLSTQEQKTELLAILDRAVHLKLNAIIFQVRPACDALYASRIEPWSEYLTGTMGKAPEPFYDPLAFAIEEAHKRGLNCTPGSILIGRDSAPLRRRLRRTMSARLARSLSGNTGSSCGWTRAKKRCRTIR